MIESKNIGLKPRYYILQKLATLKSARYMEKNIYQYLPSLT